MLVIEPEPDLRDLEELVLTDAGYRVETLPEQADPVDFAARTRPDAIVLGIFHPEVTKNWQTLDKLQADPHTMTIPVVVISTSERAAARAQASPITGSESSTVIAPYDIVALDDAVAHALKNPPPAAALPKTHHPTPKAITLATNAISAHARHIVLETIRRLQGIEPYKSRFAELTKGLVDDLGTMMGAIVEGLRRGLPPEKVFAAPTIRRSIDEHVALRESQGLGPSTTIRETQMLREDIDHFLQGQIGQHGFTARDAFDASVELQPYLNELVRVIVEEFAKSSRGNRGGHD